MSNQCGPYSCQFTSNRSKLKEADAVLFHGSNLLDLHNLPNLRKPNQLYIFFTFEAPPCKLVKRIALCIFL